ncbi:hypothetical protein [uncultured Jatrophihabitans sp.]|uniref:hypothetical protein n=1 Tax=uncultured Jatrophihabitans sp. TaxID=1610747 RepID=UPI0035CAF31F
MDTKYAACACAANREFAAPARPAAHPVIRRLIVLAGLGVGFWLLTCLLHAAPASASTARPVHPLAGVAAHRTAQPVTVVAEAVHRARTEVAAPARIVHDVHTRLAATTHRATGLVRTVVSRGSRVVHRTIGRTPAAGRQVLGTRTSPAAAPSVASVASVAQPARHSARSAHVAAARVTAGRSSTLVREQHTTATAPHATKTRATAAHTAAAPNAGTPHAPLPRAPHMPGQPLAPVSGRTTPEHSGAALFPAAQTPVRVEHAPFFAGPRTPAGVAGDEPTFSPD